MYGWWRGNHCRRYGFKVIGRAVDFKKVEVGRAGYITRAPPPNVFDHPVTIKSDPLVEGVGGAGIGVMDLGWFMAIMLEELARSVAAKVTAGRVECAFLVSCSGPPN